MHQCSTGTRFFFRLFLGGGPLRGRYRGRYYRGRYQVLFLGVDWDELRAELRAKYLVNTKGYADFMGVPIIFQ